MRNFGLIGYPLGHSFSEAYFTNKFRQSGISDACYKTLPIESVSELPSLILTHHLQGFNVTIPYKKAVIPYLSELTPEAAAIGAVNTVKVMWEGGHYRLKGYNTDAPAFGKDLLNCGIHGIRKALLLGTGGAAMAVKYFLEEAGLSVSLVSRDAQKAHYTYEMLNAEIIRNHLLIINATPLGMHPKTEEFPPIPYLAMGSGHLAYDLIYNPATTVFMQKAMEAGARAANGLNMLHFQADLAWELWNA
jgi:shikimate dehydrogenase